MSAGEQSPHDPGKPQDGDAARLGPGDPTAAADDSRMLQILSTEHWSLLAERSLVYNEAFTRVGTFLGLMSMSLVGLALLAQAMTFGRNLLIVAALTLGFDLLVGLATIVRVLAAVDDDLRTLHGMSRIRHGYLTIEPQLRPYFISPVHDDVRSVMAGYGNPHVGLTGVVYFLSTSLGLMVLLVSVLAGVFTVVTVLAAGASGALGTVVGVAVAVGSFLGLGMVSKRAILAGQSGLDSVFPAPAEHDA
jgi:hypothetical protein